MLVNPVTFVNSLQELVLNFDIFEMVVKISIMKQDQLLIQFSTKASTAPLIQVANASKDCFSFNNIGISTSINVHI